MNKKKMKSQESQLLELFREIIFCHYQLVSLGKELGAVSDAGIPTWNLLKSLLQQAMTVPELAHERSVSRQYIQKNVNKLIEQRLIAKKQNKSHQRSYLLEVTEEGRCVYEKINEHLLSESSQLTDNMTKSELTSCKETVVTITKNIQAYLSK